MSRSRPLETRQSDSRLPQRAFLIKNNPRPKQPNIELHHLWDELNIPYFHRAYFLQYSNDTARETTELTQGTAPVIKLQLYIQARENCLQKLRRDPFREDHFSELLADLRLLTLNVVEHFDRWRQQLNPAARWRIKEVDYMDKLRQDTHFLQQHYPSFKQNDPFFFWLLKLGYLNEGVHRQYHLLGRDLQRRMRECELLLLQLDYQNQQTNILSRKDAQVVHKYLQTGQRSESQSQTRAQPRVKEETQKEQLGKGQLLKGLNALPMLECHYEILMSFPEGKPDLSKETLVFQFGSFGVVQCEGESDENYKRWMISQVRIGNVEHFSHIIGQVVEELQGHEIQVRLVHYKQQEQLTDNRAFKEKLKQLGFKWKQIINENDLRYTIYYKRKEFTLQANLQLRMKLCHQPPPPILAVIKTSKPLLQKYIEKHLVTNSSNIMIADTEDTSTLFLIEFRFANMSTDVINNIKYARFKDCLEYNDQYAIEMQKYTLVISKNHELSFQESNFKPMQKDLLIPMFDQTAITVDTFEHSITFKLDSFVPYSKQGSPGVVIDEPFYIGLFKRSRLRLLLRISNFLPFSPTQFCAPVLKDLMEEFQIQSVDPEAFEVSVGGTNFIIGIDREAVLRRWAIYSIKKSLKSMKDNLQNIIEFIIELDPYVEEIMLNFHHKLQGDRFVINNAVQDQIKQCEFKWRQQVNEHNMRYTKYVFKMSNEQVACDLLIKYDCYQNSMMDLTPLFRQVARLHGNLTHSQILVRKANMIPFASFMHDTLFLELSQVVSGTVAEENYLQIHSSQCFVSLAQELTIYLVVLNQVILCYIPLKKRFSASAEELSSKIMNISRSVSRGP